MRMHRDNDLMLWYGCTETAQRTRDAIIMSSLRRRRRVDVVKTLSLCHYCVMCPLGDLMCYDMGAQRHWPDVLWYGCTETMTWDEWVIKFNGLSGDSGQRGPYSPYKPCNHSLYIGIIIFPHIYNTIYRPQLTLRKKELKKRTTKSEGTH